MIKKPTTSSFLQDDTKMPWQPWREDIFQADIYVRAMDWLQKSLYKNLLQSAWVCSTRPHLPNDENILWLLAGCKDREMWEQNKSVLLARFTEDEIDGHKILKHKRVASDWDGAMASRSARSTAGRKAGKASAAKRLKGKQELTAVERSSADDEQTSTTEQRIPTKRSKGKRSKGNESEVNLSEPTLPPDGGADGSLEHPKSPNSNDADKSREPRLTFADLQSVWTECGAEPRALPRSGWGDERGGYEGCLEHELNNAGFLARPEIVKEAFEEWIRDRYERDDRESIHSPLALFAKEFSIYVQQNSHTRMPFPV